MSPAYGNADNVRVESRTESGRWFNRAPTVVVGDLVSVEVDRPTAVARAILRNAWTVLLNWAFRITPANASNVVVLLP
jgi:hypothetical protein